MQAEKARARRLGGLRRRALGPQVPRHRRLLEPEALHAKLCRAVRARGHFPHDAAVLKLLFLVLNLAVKVWRRPAREWTAAKAQFAILFEDRFAIT